MNYITVNIDSIENEHICCSLADKKGETNIASKKAWMKSNFDSGLVFRKLDVRGKVFIEYIPAENAWVPIEAPKFMYINCLWVSGQYKGQGHGGRLLDFCTEDAKRQGMDGICVISSAKKIPFLSEPKFFKHRGFIKADEANPYYELLYKSIHSDRDITVPKFKIATNNSYKEGITVFFTNQCPFAEKYANIFKKMAESAGAPIKLVKLESKDKSQKAPVVFTTYSVMYNGELITNEMLSEKKIEKYLNEWGYIS